MHKDTPFSKKHLIRIRGKYLDLSTPKIMGILNITPDSFYDGGRFLELNSMLAQVDKMNAEGADIIDIGASSSRPGADLVNPDEELSRLCLALEAIRSHFQDIIISVDTFRSEVARKVVNEYGVNIVNDISAGLFDPAMSKTIAELQVPYIIMHMRGNPADMQHHTNYDDLLKEIIQFLGKRTGILKSEGINDIIIDPGFGFSKTLDQNYQLLAHLDTFNLLEYPLLIGISRKSMIYKLLDISPEDALNGTTALHFAALLKGANILRVHDVKEAKQTVQLFLKMEQEGSKYQNQ
jgi:dihydropteroate synthase